MAENTLKPAEASAQFGLSRSTLLRYEQQGKLNPVRTPGGQRRYSKSELDALTSTGEKDQTDIIQNNRLYQEFGVMGMTRWGGSMYQEQLRELQGRSGRKLLREMRMNDPVIFAIFFAVESVLKGATWRISPVSESPADKDCAIFIQECLDDMSFTWADTLDQIFTCFEQGFSVMELVYKKRMGENPSEYIPGVATSKYNDGRVGWRKWALRPAESLVDGDEFIIDETGGIHGVNQETPNRALVQIPIEKLLLFRTTVIPPVGIPIHRGMYTSWWYSQNIQEIEGIGMERDLAGIPVVYLGEDATMSGPNSDYEMAKQLVSNLRADEQAGVVIPRPKLGTAGDGRGILLELLASQGRRQYDTNAIIERYDKRKALSVLAQFIMLGMSNVGSFALSKDQSDLFTTSITGWLNSLSDVINRYAIPRLLKYNTFPDITGMPTLVFSSVGIPDLATIATFVNQLVSKDVLTPDPELERHLRQIARFPELKPQLDENGNPTSTKKSNIGIEKAALLVRRTGLAVKALQDLGLMDIATAQKIVSPLVGALEAGITNEILMGGPLPEVSMPTPDEIAQEDGVPPGEPPM